MIKRLALLVFLSFFVGCMDYDESFKISFILGSKSIAWIFPSGEDDVSHFIESTHGIVIYCKGKKSTLFVGGNSVLIEPYSMSEQDIESDSTHICDKRR